MRRFIFSIIFCMATASYAVVNCPAVNPDSADAVVCMTFQGTSGHITQLVVNGKTIGRSDCTTPGTVSWVPNNDVLDLYHVGTNYQNIYQCADSSCKQKVLINTYTFDLSNKDKNGKYNATPAYDTINVLSSYGSTCISTASQNQSPFLKHV